MITSIALLASGIGVVLGSGVAISTALAWMNNFDVDLSKKKVAKGKGPNSSRAAEGRNRMGKPHSADMFE